MIRQAAIATFLRRHGFAAAQVAPLAQDASFRRYWRLTGGPCPAVLMDAPPPEDVRPFLHLAAHLAGLGLSVPHILAADPEAGFVLEEDLGDDLFSTLLDSGAAPASQPQRHPGSSPDRRAGSSPDRHAGSSPDRRAGSSPHRHAGSSPDRRAGSSPDRHAGSSPARHAGSSPARHAGSSPDRHAGSSPARHAGSSPARHAGSSPDRRAGSSPDRRAGSSPARHPRACPEDLFQHGAVGDPRAKPGDDGFVRPGDDGFAPPGDDGFVRPGDDGFVRLGDDGFAPPGDDGFAPPGDDGFVPPGDDGFVRPGDDGFVRPGDDCFVRPGDDGFVRPGDDGFVRPGDDGFVRPEDDVDAKPGVALFDAAVDALVTIQRAAPPPGLPSWDAAAMAETALGTLFDWWWPARYGTAAPAAARAEVAAALATMLRPVAEGPKVLVHRDFFAGNLIWLPDRTGARRAGIIDFQGAAIGHPAYDLVSLVQDARRDIDPVLAEHAVTRFLAARPELDPAAFHAAFAACAAQRHLRVACQWVRLARRDGKPHYLAFGPRTWALLDRALSQPAAAPLADALARWIPAADRGNPPGFAA